MRNLFRQLDIIKELQTNKQLISSGYTVEGIIKDLFDLLGETLWDLNTSLRKYVVFNKTISNSSKVLAFQKPDVFLEKYVLQSGIPIPFTGILKSTANGKEVAAYIDQILGAYTRNEEALLAGIKYKLKEIRTKCLEMHGINLDDKDVPLLNGYYHSHNIKISQDCGINEIRLSGQSSLTLFL